MNFEDRFRVLSLEEIEEFNSLTTRVELNNVIKDFAKHYFHMGLNENEDIEDYILMYVGNHNSKIKGFALKNGRSSKDRDIDTLRFSQQIELHYPNLNPLVIFNTFQKHTKSVYEKYGIVCLPQYITDSEYSTSMILKNKEGIDSILEINIHKLYKSFFNSKNTALNEKGKQKIYLMYDYEYDKVKIGETKDILKKRQKGIAEPTLRARKQHIYIIAAWEAPKYIEDELMFKYNHKRVRGEWFDLRAVDMKEINQMLSTYNMIEFDS